MDPSSSTSLSDWKLDVRFEDGKRYHDMPEGTHCWEQVERLGEGTCGEVWKEQCLSDNFSSSSVFRAVKHIDKRRGRWTHTSKREIKALTTFSDNNVVEVSLEATRYRRDFQGAAGEPKEPEAASITGQIAQALLYMHSKNFIHRDLKPLNILVSHPGPAWHVKVADFGLTRDLSDGITGTHQIGTNGYMAPEMWDTSQSYTSAIDVWALGAITFCMLAGSPPFLNPMTLPDYRKDPTLFPTSRLRSSTEPCRGFITGAMAANPEERLTVEEALKHYWLSKSKNTVCR
ncbi:kinase-like domain-containing protein [Neurospora tetraspora]|uniref:non-specific serine/threonine protein kinase n=1 Tax=Neurospora tetraspora TaxID=94610 RepID=A0AAE0MQG2_9PEZI|nr:kinase-like domain-containing protein [Neurospora tetraspora]